MSDKNVLFVCFEYRALMNTLRLWVFWNISNIPRRV